jgi:NAD(P)-dependent dehydrogenase (short-subunit alcohol dehydrogenase family)
MSHTRHLVVITGATRGLGRLAAERFWKAGEDLILVARHEKDLKIVAEEFGSTGRSGQKIFHFAVDLSDLEHIPDFIAGIQKSAGDPDILINNAAIQGPIGPVQTNDWTEWQKCLNVCLLAPVWLSRGLLPSMIKKGYGRIVNISGGGATAPRPNFTSYATAKCGLVRFSETLALEVRPHGITVNCVAPGAMNSALTQNIIQAGMQYAGDTEFDSAVNLTRNNPHAEERAADLIYFLTTDTCASITGKLISAVWDPWEKISNATPELMDSDVYTLRRIVPKDRNLIIE